MINKWIININGTRFSIYTNSYQEVLQLLSQIQFDGDVKLITIAKAIDNPIDFNKLEQSITP